MEDMVAESVKYTILGMGVVFLFLYTLVLLLRLQKNLIARYKPESCSVPVDHKRAAEMEHEELKRRKKVAAMMAAIHHHKKRQGQ
ncbi:OadG family transporter subunit [Hydrogenimonas sp.]|uniref:OadG family protein n=1 Tax=Hydrogenimonas sp. TaxID=2231112 RepID=UPI00262B1408|nr:OadG family transporter subunit [Hydrogenimonas sp.]